MTNQTDPARIASAALATAHRAYNRARSVKTTTRAQATRAAISAVRAYRRARAAYHAAHTLARRTIATGYHPAYSQMADQAEDATFEARIYAGAAIMAARVIHPKTA